LAARNVMMAIPTRDPSVKVDVMTSMVSTMYELGAAGISMSVFVWSGDPLVSHARNIILAKFMTTDCTDLFFIDDDVAWAPGSVLRLLNHPGDLVAGAYRHKRDPESYPVNWFGNDLRQLQMNKNTGLLLVRDVPFGFARLSRAGVQKMWDAAADKKFRTNQAPELECRVIFDMGYTKQEGEEFGEYFGEDYVYCQKWRELGGQVWLDPMVDLTHHGNKAYQGRVIDWLSRVPSDTKPVPKFRVGASGKLWPQEADEPEALASLFKERGVKRFLEIGGRYGDTFDFIMSELGTDAQGVSVDLPGADGYEDDGGGILAATVKKHGGELIVGNSRDPDVIARVKALGPFDAILIDGDHSYEGVKADWDAYGAMAPIVVFHDIANPTEGVGVPRLWSELVDGYDHAKIISGQSVMGFGVVFREAEAAKVAA
jgi:hypothetical protein